jgi:hypothetical protein
MDGQDRQDKERREDGIKNLRVESSNPSSLILPILSIHVNSLIHTEGV